MLPEDLGPIPPGRLGTMSPAPQFLWWGGKQPSGPIGNRMTHLTSVGAVRPCQDVPSALLSFQEGRAGDGHGGPRNRPSGLVDRGNSKVDAEGRERLAI